jgi:hypothetical protein
MSSESSSSRRFSVDRWMAKYYVCIILQNRIIEFRKKKKMIRVYETGAETPDTCRPHERTRLIRSYSAGVLSIYTAY